MKKHDKLLKEAVSLNKRIERIKKLYQRLDEVTMQLKDAGFKASGPVTLVDNFREKNTAFRTTSIKRFELNFNTKVSRPRSKK